MTGNPEVTPLAWLVALPEKFLLVLDLTGYPVYQDLVSMAGCWPLGFG